MTVENDEESGSIALLGPRLPGGEAACGARVTDALRILVVDDDAILRAGLTLLLEREEGFDCVGAADSAEQALELMARLQPRLVIMDLEMPGMGGLEGVLALRERHPGVAVLVLSMHGEGDWVRRAFVAGADGYVRKTALPQELGQAIRSVAAGVRYLHPALGAALIEPVPDRTAVDLLTPRELEVLRLLAVGYSNREIADSLVISVRTVESHRARLMAKLEARTRSEIVRHAMLAGLLKERDDSRSPAS
jgi:two-component system response regulator NreC